MDEDLPVPLEIDSLWNEERVLGARLSRSRRPKKLDREQQVLSIVEAFHQIGGQARLADWANNYPTLFFTKVFPKAFPQGGVNALINNGSLNIQYQPAIPPSPLDNPIDVPFTETQ